jgi:putative ABC transport system permease protein
MSGTQSGCSGDAILLRTIHVRNPAQLFTFHWSASYPEYLEYAARTDLFTGVLASAGSPRLNVTVDGASELVNATFVSGNYFDVLGVGAAAGRMLLPADDVRNGPIAAVAGYQWWRSRFAGDPSFVGRMVQVNGQPVIVGVVEDTIVRELGEQPAPQVYLPFAQTEAGGTLDPAHLFVRTTGDIAALLPNIRARLLGLDPSTPSYDLTTFDWHLRQLVMPQRMGATLFATFSLLAVALASIGIYGVASYVAALRTREMGIRIALGADPTRIRALVIRDIAAPIAGGVAAGLVIALLASRLAAAFLRGITPRDPLTYVTAAALLALTALAATWLPARRAARLDPIRALRQD